YGMIRWKQSHAGFEDWGLEFGNPDFVKYAESYGATGHRVDSAENLIPTFEKAFEAVRISCGREGARSGFVGRRVDPAFGR
ncbi:MAG TPA: thiamine pyrophosphate-dependent enzyme, partial [Clostridiales bacterium]|nr:thiamine pyrophosphate-dependent enzyme [Clostridiales bacterium]